MRRWSNIMPNGASQYPIAQCVSRLMNQYGLSKVEFVQALGYRKTDRGLQRLNSWLERAEGYKCIVQQIASVFPAHAAELQEAVAETAKIRAAEAEAAWLERCKAE